MFKQAACVLSKRSSKVGIAPTKKESIGNLAPTAYFTNAASRTGTVFEHARASYWRKMRVALPALQGTTETEHRYEV